MYMPPKEFVTKDYLKQILRNEKELILMDHMKPIKVPRYPELSVKSLYQQVMDDENLKIYFPDFDINKKTMDREYFFNVLNTIYPDYVKTIIEHAQNSRNAPENDEKKKDYILISDDWYEKLMSHPFISKKPGKTIQLLKESTKMFKGRRQKQRNDIGISLKRFKGMETEQSTSQQQITHNVQQLSQDNEYELSEDQSPQRKRIFQI